VIVNKKFWDGLPGPIRDALAKAMQEATAFTNESAQRDNDDAMAEMRRGGRIQFIELTPEQKTSWRRALEPVQAEMTSRVGKDTIEEFRREAGVS